MVFSIGWALTQRSFPRISPDSSKFSGVILKFFFKVWCKYELSSVIFLLQDCFQNIFIVGSTFLFFIPECLNNSWWCFSSSFSDLKTEEEFLLNPYPFSWWFMVLASCHPLKSFPIMRILFIPIRSISWVLSILFLRRPSFRIYSFSTFSLHPRIVLVHRSSILESACHLFVILYLNSLKYLYSFSNCSRQFVLFSSIVFNSYGGLFKIPLPMFSY